MVVDSIPVPSILDPMTEIIDPKEESREGLHKDLDTRYLTDKCYNFVSTEVVRGRELANKLSYALTKRADIEDNYARDLGRIVDSLGDIDSTDPIDQSICEYQTYLNNLKASHAEVAKNLREDVIPTLRMMLTNHINVWTNLDADHTSLLTKQKKIESSSLEITNELALRSTNFKSLIANALTIHPCLSIHEHNKAMNSILEASLEVRNSEYKVKKTTEAHQAFKKNCATQKSYMIRSLDDMDKKRKACCRDTLSKCLVFELSHLRDSIYEAEKLQKPFEENVVVSEDSVINRYIKEFPEEESPVVPTATKNESWITVEPVQNNPLSKRITSETTKGFSAMVNQIVTTANLEGSLVGPLMRDMSSMFHTFSTSQQTERRFSSSSSSCSGNEAPQTGGFEEEEVIEPRIMLKDIDNIFEDLAKGNVPVIGGSTDDFIMIYYSLIRAIMNEEIEILTLELGEQIKDQLSSSLFRCILLEAATRILDETNGCLPSMLSLRVLTKMFMWGLDWADSQNDAQFGQWVVCNAMRFEAYGFEDDDPQKKSWHWPKTDTQRARLRVRLDNYNEKMAATAKNKCLVWSMYQAIYSHRMLNRVVFWEAALTGLFGSYQLLNFLEEWWSSDPTKYPEDVKGRYRTLYHLKVAPCLQIGLKQFPSIMQSYGVVHVQIEHMIMKLSVKYQIDSDILKEMYSDFQIDPALNVEEVQPVEDTLQDKQVDEAQQLN